MKYRLPLPRQPTQICCRGIIPKKTDREFSLQSIFLLELFFAGLEPEADFKFFCPPGL